MSHHRSWGPEFESLFNQHGPQGRRGGDWGGPWGGLGSAGPALGTAAVAGRAVRPGRPGRRRRAVRGYDAVTCAWRSSRCSPRSR